jgi:hypothetical protein
MKNAYTLLNLVVLSGISALITSIIYLADFLLLSTNEYFSPTDAMFIEGILCIVAGLLLLLGRGGIDLWSQRAAILSALAEAIYHRDTVGPSEELRRDKWKPQGFIRLALILILAGVIMILIYFLAL